MATKAVSHIHFGSLCRAAKAIPGWTFEFAQLERGECGGEMLSVMQPALHFMQVRMDKSVQRGGWTPEGQVSLAIHAAPSLSARTHGEAFDENVVVLTPGGSLIDTVAPGKTDLFALSIREDVFGTMLEKTQSPLRERLGTVQLLAPSPERMNRLRRALWGAREQALAGKCDDATWSAVNTAVAACFSSVDDPGRVPPASPRRRVVVQSLNYMRKNLSTPLKLEDLCREAGVSERTLIYAFKQHMGVTPKAYLNISRLNKVRQELECFHATSVTDAATRWGFWHMGQFSADYKRFFGELPSQTLSRFRGTES